MRHIILMLLIGFGSTMVSQVSAQKLPERGEVRRGNESFLKDDYEGAAKHYVKAIEYAPENFEARYNLGSALFKGEKLEESEKMLSELAADSLLSDADRSVAYYNLGNSQFAQQKLEEALESYKSSMRLDPDDQEAKYNYAYTKALIEQQEQNQDQNQDQQDQNQDQNQDKQDQNQDQQSGDDESDQNQDQNQGDDQEGDQDQNQDQDQDQDQGDDEQDGQNQDQQDGDGDQENQGGQQPQGGGISEQEQEQMLDAIQAQEDKTQDDLKEKAAGVVIPGAKNW